MTRSHECRQAAQGCQLNERYSVQKRLIKDVGEHVVVEGYDGADRSPSSPPSVGSRAPLMTDACQGSQVRAISPGV